MNPEMASILSYFTVTDPTLHAFIVCCFLWCLPWTIK